MKHAVLSFALASLALAACGGSTAEAPNPAAATTSTTAAPSKPAPAAAASSTASTAPPAQAPSAPGDTPAPSAPATDTTAQTGDASSAPTPSAAASAKPSPKKISARHILIEFMGCQSASSSVVRTRDQAYAVAKDVLRRAKKGEDFARLAVEFSDEPNAGERGGSLGRFGRGAMVKQFEDAAFALQPGEISDVVESPFGFHIIQRTE
jgi:NIMA-interacting peptidyl-prolyl cis-trans isomerase 1